MTINVTDNLNIGGGSSNLRPADIGPALRYSFDAAFKPYLDINILPGNICEDKETNT